MNATDTEGTAILEATAADVDESTDASAVIRSDTFMARHQHEEAAKKGWAHWPVPPQLPTPNFRFYQYGVEAVDKRGDLIDSFRRRAQLFDMGLWNGSYRDMSAKEKESLKRTVFFKGSYFYSSRPLLGLEQQNLPATLVDGQTSEGDVLRVVNVQCFTLPAEMKSGAATSTGTGVSMDRRCAN